MCLSTRLLILYCCSSIRPIRLGRHPQREIIISTVLYSTITIVYYYCSALLFITTIITISTAQLVLEVICYSATSTQLVLDIYYNTAVQCLFIFHRAFDTVHTNASVLYYPSLHSILKHVCIVSAHDCTCTYIYTCTRNI